MMQGESVRLCVAVLRDSLAGSIVQTHRVPDFSILKGFLHPRRKVVSLDIHPPGQKPIPVAGKSALPANFKLNHCRTVTDN